MNSEASERESPYVIQQAKYRTYPGRRYAGNPFVEALPFLEDDDSSAILRHIEHFPEEPRLADRKLPVLIRVDEVDEIDSIIYPFASYRRFGPSIYSVIKDAYHARNPISLVDRQRRTLIAQAKGDQKLVLPSDWNCTSKGLGLFGTSGTGKTTVCRAVSLPLQTVIEHTKYKDHPLVCRQIPWLGIQIPHDATVRSLCIQFFSEVDAVLANTQYEREARGVGGIAEMALLMTKVATAVSLGALFVDDLQNLKAARGPQIEFVLNLFSQLMDKGGISIVVAGTPAIGTLVETNVRNIRKLVTGGETRLEPMRWKSAELFAFQDAYWPYQWVKTPKRLTLEIRRAWFEASGGNPAFLVLAFSMAQRIEIGGREVIDEISFARALRECMPLLIPAVRALLSGDRAALLRFDDLLFTKPFDALRRDIQREAPHAADDVGPVEEFEEVLEAEAEATKEAPKKSRKASTPAKRVRRANDKAEALPQEDPLAMR